MLKLGDWKLANGLHWINGATKALESSPAMLRRDRDDLAKTPTAAYELVPWVNRCVQIRANAVASMPFIIKRWEEHPQPPPPQLPGMPEPPPVKPEEVPSEEIPWTSGLPDLLWRTEASLCVYGRAYWMWEKNYVVTLNLQYLVPTTIREKYSRKQGIVGFTRTLVRPGMRGRRYGTEEDDEPLTIDEQIDPGIAVGLATNTKQDLTPGDVIYFWYPDPSVEIGPGRSPVAVALESASLARSVGVFSTAFFDRGAIPAVLLQVEGNPPEAELHRIEAWWKKTVRGMGAGVRRAWETVAVKAMVKPVIIGQPIKDLGMPTLKELVRREICAAMGVPVTLLEDSANFASAESHKKSFYHETVIPECKLIQEVINRQLLHPLGMELTFQFENHPVMQEDEAQKAGSLGALVNTGFTLIQAMEELGYDIRPELRAELEQQQAVALQARQQQHEAQLQMQKAQLFAQLSTAILNLRNGGMNLLLAMEMAGWPMTPDQHSTLTVVEAHKQGLIEESEQQRVEQQRVALETQQYQLQDELERRAMGIPAGPGGNGTPFGHAARLQQGLPAPAAPRNVAQDIEKQDMAPARGTILGNNRGRGFGA